MYAPKFVSWMSDEERFHSALDARIAPLLEEMRAECKQMLVKAEEDLRLRPTKEETDLQMKYNQATGLVSYYNAHQTQNGQLSQWYSMQAGLVQNSIGNLLAFGGNRYENPYGNPYGETNGGLFE